MENVWLFSVRMENPSWFRKDLKYCLIKFDVQFVEQTLNHYYYLLSGLRIQIENKCRLLVYYGFIRLLIPNQTIYH